ncbi:acetylxylan esterase [Actinoplanes sp. NPDC051343]|uniref:acetylxylan esterase n=1 Tax=Actinoplanes sp. NPDC051343 TaxID=3363906 RepID=UPI003787ED14
MAQFDLPVEQLAAFNPSVAAPDDFDEFWRSTLASAGEHDLGATFTEVDVLLPEVRVYDVRFAGYAGQPVAAWFLTPASGGGPRPCVVNFIGYGGGRGRPHEWLVWPAAGFSVLVMDSRGQGDGDTEDVPGVGVQHRGLITRGVLNRDDYYYRRLFTDAVRAVDAALTRPEVDPSRVVVAGASQGGALSQAVAGLRADLAGAIVDVPFLTHFRRATEITDAYPYRELSDMLQLNRDKVDDVFATLSYFDGLHFAARGTAPALYTVGLMDAICPPSTVYAAYNRYPGPKQIQVWPYNGHESGATFQPPVNLRWLRTVLGS